jgi:hypothetical protein
MRQRLIDGQLDLTRFDCPRVVERRSAKARGPSPPEIVQFRIVSRGRVALAPQLC